MKEQDRRPHTAAGLSHRPVDLGPIAGSQSAPAARTRKPDALGGDAEASRIREWVGKPDGVPNPEESPLWRLLVRTLQETSGFERGVVYQVRREDAPRPVRGSAVYLHGSAAWHRYIRTRARFDDGTLTPVLSLRSMGRDERRLVAGWGAAFANTFLLIEPRDPVIDLLDPSDALRRRIDSAARAVLRRCSPDDDPGRAWTRETELGGLLRSAYGVWLCWSGPATAGSPRRIKLSPSAPDDTLAGLLDRALLGQYPQSRFDAAVADLLETQPELFHGPVATIRIPFKTRFGLPVLHDPYFADRALRRLVNEGRVRVFNRRAGYLVAYRGPDNPVPDDLRDEDFARLSL
jgi:hypothetical protein